MLGIDVSKKTLACTLIDPATRDKVWFLQVNRDPQGIQALLDKTPQETDWVLEPTGRYSHLVVQSAQEAGRKALLASPRKAKDFLRSRQQRAKTDKIDSFGLAQFALSQNLPDYRLNSPAVEELEQLLKARKQLAKAHSALKQQQEQLPLSAPLLAPAIKQLSQQMKAIEDRIQEVIASQPEFGVAKKLEQVPGIGKVSAAAMAARLCAKQFQHPDQLVAYIGLDISVKQSGQSRGQFGLSKHGDAELRRLLYLCAQASRRAKNSPFSKQYERERAKGLKSTAALCAVARKMAKVCWALWRYDRDYDAERVYTRPPKKSEEAADERGQEDKATLTSDLSA